jgi:hypothetical protein
MNKKEFIAPVLIIGLSFLFAVICITVFFSNGKSKKWIARKMKIGGLLLTLTAVSCNGGGGEVNCYDVAETNAMWINNTSQNGIEVKLDTGNMLNGTISTVEGKDFSFLISDSTGKKFQKGQIVLIKDTAGYSENFNIELAKSLKPGKYKLMLYASKIENQDSIGPKRNFNLMIKNE